jgi:pilus assembly protein FimV
VRKLTINPVTSSQPIKAAAPTTLIPKTTSFVPPTTWHTPIAAAALALVLSFASQDAAAIALGRANVLSGLGEPLRVEIDVPEITAEEASTLRTSIASADSFRAAGLEYNPALSTAQISLQRRTNGSAFLRLSSERTINEPFVDLILEASSASGRVVRDYTLLFDPSTLRAKVTAPTATVPAVTSAPISTASRTTSPANAPQTLGIERPLKGRMATKSTAKTEKVSKAAPKEGITVKAGDTATALAARYKPANVSLDQMLVAMLNSSPDAFIGGNINRLKSGAVIDMQAANAAAPATSDGDAKQTILAQSKDFNEFRRRLASGAPTAAAAAPSRAADGKVQASVSEPKTQATAPDKLTLSKGTVAAKAKEEAIAKDKQSKDSAARVAELSKNMADLNKFNTTTVVKPSAGLTPAAAAAPAASTPGMNITAAATATQTVAATTPDAVIAIITPTVAALTTSTTATIMATTTATVIADAAAPAASAPVVDIAKPKAIAPPPPPEPSFIESLMNSRALLPGAGALLAGLAGLAFWRHRQRKKAAQVDSSFLESRLQPDSFFGASGGQRVDTADSGNAAGVGSSMVYSPSQLDAAGDVDPVAEADVYLAYGRDLQAEEILKEALRTSPSRVAVYTKLLEIYAKRRDTKAFETVAKEAFALSKGEGADWDASSALGREIDPANPLYKQGNGSSSIGLAGKLIAGGAAAAVTATAALGAVRTAPILAQPAQDDDLDLDLDFSAGGDLVSAPSFSGMINTPSMEETTAGIRSSVVSDPMVDFDMSEPAVLDTIKLSAPDFASFSSDLNFSGSSNSTSTPTAPTPLKTEPSARGALEFNMSNLSLDLPRASSPSDATEAAMSGDPLETKLALALEFRDIGDVDGARSLTQEVADEATGALKARAVKMLADLG